MVHLDCSSLNWEKTSSSKTLPSVFRWFQREPLLDSSWDQSTRLPCPHSERAAILLQVRTTKGLIKIGTYTSLHTLNNLYIFFIYILQIWRNPAHFIPANKKASDNQRARNAPFSLCWFRNLHNTFFTSSKTFCMHVFTDLIADQIILQPKNSSKSANPGESGDIGNITLCVLYICMPEFSLNKFF